MTYASDLTLIAEKEIDLTQFLKTAKSHMKHLRLKINNKKFYTTIAPSCKLKQIEISCRAFGWENDCNEDIDTYGIKYWGHIQRKYVNRILQKTS